MNWKSKRALIGLSIVMIIATACKKEKNTDDSATVYGPSAPLNKGTMRSFLTLGKDGKPTAVGIKFSATSLDGLPIDTTKEWEFPLELPDQAKITGFDHLVVDWNPQGHPPAPIYTWPHFDFHFYRVTKEEQATVVPGPDLTPVPPMFLPKDYISGVMAVPDMGVHWVDSLSPEFHGSKFTSTFIYGFYQGHLTFMEPMATREWLQTKPNSDADIKQPKAFENNGYYPTSLHYDYDEKNAEYTVSLTGLLWHAAGK